MPENLHHGYASLYATESIKVNKAGTENRPGFLLFLVYESL